MSEYVRTPQPYQIAGSVARSRLHPLASEESLASPHEGVDIRERRKFLPEQESEEK